MSKEWKCRDCLVFGTDACHFPSQKEEYKACEHLVMDYDVAYQQGRADKYQEITSEYMLLTEKQVKEIRADAIEELKKKIEFEEKWLFDCKVFDVNVTIAFETLKSFAEQLKGAEE